jgi:hypothetical protein
MKTYDREPTRLSFCCNQQPVLATMTHKGRVMCSFYCEACELRGAFYSHIGRAIESWNKTVKEKP